MKSIPLEERPCARDKCSNTFKVMGKSQQEYCSKYCLDIGMNTSHKEKQRRGIISTDRRLLSKASQGQETSEKTALYGTQEHGDRQSRMNAESRKCANTGNVRMLKEGKTSKRKENSTVIASGEKKNGKEKENITGKTKNARTKDDQSTEDKIGNSITKRSENIMPKTEKNNLQKSSNDDMSETPQSDLSQFSMILKEEQSSSIQQLNDMSTQLVGLAKSLTNNEKVGDDGVIYKRNPSHNIDTAVKCLAEARNTMKIKLDFLRFGKELTEKR